MVLTVGLAGVDCGCDITAVSSDQKRNFSSRKFRSEMSDVSGLRKLFI